MSDYQRSDDEIRAAIEHEFFEHGHFEAAIVNASQIAARRWSENYAETMGDAPSILEQAAELARALTQAQKVYETLRERLVVGEAENLLVQHDASGTVTGLRHTYPRTGGRLTSETILGWMLGEDGTIHDAPEEPQS